MDHRGCVISCYLTIGSLLITTFLLLGMSILSTSHILDYNNTEPIDYPLLGGGIVCILFGGISGIVLSILSGLRISSLENKVRRLEIEQKQSII